jgi:glucokinase
MAENAIGIDLGGTRIKGVLLSVATGETLEAFTMDTNADRSDHWKDGVRELERKLRSLSVAPVAGVGLAAPGLVASDSRTIATMPGRMSGLEGLDWSSFLGIPVRVVNDAHAALVAEVCFGCAKGQRNVVMLTLGTGVGGGLWLNGSLVLGKSGRAGHLGHISMQSESRILGITNIPGSLEDAIGNHSVSRRSYQQYTDTASLVRAYEEGEPVATLTWLESVRNLAAAIASITNSFAPDAVILGGGIAGAGDSLFRPLESYLRLFEWDIAAGVTPVLKAQHGEWSGAIGAAAWMIHNQ